MFHQLCGERGMLIPHRSSSLFFTLSILVGVKCLAHGGLVCLSLTNDGHLVAPTMSLKKCLWDPYPF